MNSPEMQVGALRERYETLSHKKTEADTNLKNAQKRLKELQDEAVQTYGTSDLEELRQKLEEMTQENERKMLEYSEHLEEIENKLADIESDPRVPSTTVDESEDSSDDEFDPFAEE